MSLDPKSPFDSSTSSGPTKPGDNPPQVSDIYAANKASSQQVLDH